MKNFFIQNEDNPFTGEMQHIALITGEKIALDIQSVRSIVKTGSKNQGSHLSKKTYFLLKHYQGKFNPPNIVYIFAPEIINCYE